MGGKRGNGKGRRTVEFDTIGCVRCTLYVVVELWHCQAGTVLDACLLCLAMPEDTSPGEVLESLLAVVWDSSAVEMVEPHHVRGFGLGVHLGRCAVMDSEGIKGVEDWSEVDSRVGRRSRCSHLPAAAAP